MHSAVLASGKVYGDREAMLKLAQAIRFMRQCRRGLTVRELANELECSIKTARRILELVDLALGLSSEQERFGVKRWRLTC